MVSKISKTDFIDFSNEMLIIVSCLLFVVFVAGDAYVIICR